jgi:hypothetical protein
VADPFPRYDVLAKRGGLSWNDKTRTVIGERLALDERADVLTPCQLGTLRRLVARIAPQPEGRPPANTVALLVDRIARDAGDGFRHARMPRFAEAWRRGLDAIDDEARARFAVPFADLSGRQADALLASLASGDARAPAWRDLPPDRFWSDRILPDITSAHWAHPSLWSAMGFGGPASPRGYVRMDADRRDPWEAEEERGPEAGRG